MIVRLISHDSFLSNSYIHFARQSEILVTLRLSFFPHYPGERDKIHLLLVQDQSCEVPWLY